ncbi:MAG: FkbM family methyltransferase [Selenomonadaceae bacterium]|nr:FkbM family methyltransferase [Selenomonadaceae bacterium]
MNDTEWQYLCNLTNAYNISENKGTAGTRRIYSLNLHHPIIPPQEYVSQEYQDYVIDNIIFHQKQGGFFLDIGANDPCFINNTFFFEKYRNWNGLAFEPLHSKNLKWTSRKTKCMQVALSNYNGTADFTEFDEDYMSGIADKVEFDGAVKARYPVEVRRLDQILQENDIHHVDYVSLDVEGAELEVLQGIDFSSCEITSFTIELTEKQETFEVRKFMIEQGYEFVGRLYFDDLWVKKGFITRN